MTKEMLLRCIKEIENKLAELQAIVEKLPEAIATLSADALTDPDRRQILEEQPRIPQFVDKQRLRPLIIKTFKEMGIDKEPIGAEKVQEMMLACGVRPEDNLFSRGIIEMREE
jgi:hypothetical protein